MPKNINCITIIIVLKVLFSIKDRKLSILSPVQAFPSYFVFLTANVVLLRRKNVYRYIHRKQILCVRNEQTIKKLVLTSLS